MRWFLDAGSAPSEQPTGRSARRVDCYDLDALRPWCSTKRRDGGVLEHKERVGRVELITVAGLVGFAETWQKQRQRRPPGRDDHWLEVRKEVWTHQEVELALVEAGGVAAWTVCIDVARPPSVAGRAALEPWWPRLRRAGEPRSYPAWLGERFGTRAIVEPVTDDGRGCSSTA